MSVELQQFTDQFNVAREKLLARKAAHQILTEQIIETEEKLGVEIDKLDLLEKVRVLLQLSAEHARDQAKEQLEVLVTNALQFVFGSMFRFEIEGAQHGGNPTADFYVASEWEGQTIRNKPQDSRGGGVVDLISLALRIALMETMRPRLQGPIILDEPCKHMSEDYIPSMIEFLKSISMTFNRQIILVSHNEHMIESADTSYSVRLNNGQSVVRSLDNKGS